MKQIDFKPIHGYKDPHLTYSSPDEDDVAEFGEMSPIWRNMIRAALIGFLVPVAVLIIAVLILEGII